MNYKIENSLDWQQVRPKLTLLLSKIRYNHDIYKVLHNIDGMVVELSKLEVEARQRKSNSNTETKLSQINDAIHYVEKMITFLILVD